VVPAGAKRRPARHLSQGCVPRGSCTRPKAGGKNTAVERCPAVPGGGQRFVGGWAPKAGGIIECGAHGLLGIQGQQRCWDELNGADELN
jgi:hypothetical protein